MDPLREEAKEAVGFIKNCEKQACTFLFSTDLETLKKGKEALDTLHSLYKSEYERHFFL